MDVGYEEMVWQMDVLHLLHGVSIDSSVDEAFLHHIILHISHQTMKSSSMRTIASIQLGSHSI